MDSPSYTPFDDHSDDTLNHYYETELILKIKAWLADVNPEAPEGMGDDCAVNVDFPQGKKVLTTIDGVHWGIHFDERVSPSNAGRKLLARNLSDIAAMGGDPVQAVVSVSAGANLKVAWLADFFAGMRDLAKGFGVKIVGGDISQTLNGQFHAELCLTGVADVPVLRTGANVGDWIVVTGSLGGSILGKHYDFTPRIAEGKWLAETGMVNSMIDLSDGLGKDLKALLDGHAAQLDIAALPASEAATLLSKESGRSVFDHMLNDGEDYELLFTIKAGTDIQEFRNQWNGEFKASLTFIGNIIASDSRFKAGMYYDQNGEGLEEGKGYEHF